MKHFVYLKNNLFGFTLVELLVVVVILGVLAATSYGVLNTSRFRNKSQDSVKQTRLQNLIQGIEAFGASEQKYPRDSNNNQNPLDTTDADYNSLKVYISEWPAGFIYRVSADRKSYATYVISSVDSTKYYKYASTWSTGSNPKGITLCASTDIATINTCN